MINQNELTVISIITTCRGTTNWQNTRAKDMCNCKGTCTSKYCVCLRGGNKCSTKCHKTNAKCENKHTM